MCPREKYTRTCTCTTRNFKTKIRFYVQPSERLEELEEFKAEFGHCNAVSAPTVNHLQASTRTRSINHLQVGATK